jgi:hypothetical protein
LNPQKYIHLGYKGYSYIYHLLPITFDFLEKNGQILLARPPTQIDDVLDSDYRRVLAPAAANDAHDFSYRGKMVLMGRVMLRSSSQ